MTEFQNLLENKNLSKEELEKNLIQACEDGRKDVVDFLLSQGVCVDCRDEEERTPLVLASMYGYENIVALILVLDNVDCVDDLDVFWALKKACENGHYKVVDVLIEHIVNLRHSIAWKSKKIAMVMACLYGHEKIVEVLIKHGVDIYERLWDYSEYKEIVKVLKQIGETIIWTRVTEGQTALMLASIGGDSQTVRLLIELGADVNARDLLSGTALMSASIEGHKTVVEILMGYGAGVDDKDRLLMTALMWACLKGREEVVMVLIKHGANVNEMNGNGQTALWYALRGRKCKIMEVLIATGADVNMTNADDGVTILMAACLVGHDKMIRLLLEHNALVNGQSKKDGSSAVMNAVRSENLRGLQTLLNVKPNLDLIDHEGHTVFSFAMHLENTKFLKFLIGNGELLDNGKLKYVHKKANISYPSLESLLLTIEAGVFEWEWCPLYFIRPVSLAAIESGLSPGKIKYKSYLSLSPLVLSLFENDTELTEIFLERLYYFPEDYRTLCTDEDIRGRITNTDALDKITLQPLSLQTWSFLAISYAISLSCRPGTRCQKVDTLPFPDKFKRILNFQS